MTLGGHTFSLVKMDRITFSIPHSNGSCYAAGQPDKNFVRGEQKIAFLVRNFYDIACFLT